MALAADADLPEPEVHRLVFKLENASMLPIVILADAEGSFLEGSSGAADPQRLKAMLERAIAEAEH